MPTLIVQPYAGRAPIVGFESFYQWPDGKTTGRIYRATEQEARDAWDGFTPVAGQSGPRKANAAPTELT